MQLRAHQVVKDQYQARRVSPTNPPSGPGLLSLTCQSQCPDGFSRLDRSQVLSESSVASVARRILVASLSPVNTPRDFFPRLFSSLSRRCFYSIRRCGDEGSRTPDIVLAKHALYQLSYVPNLSGLARQPCVRVLGFEPRTSALSELRSSQLSYTRLLRFSPHETRRPNRFGLAPSDPGCVGKAIRNRNSAESGSPTPGS
jgi:hypothetical protein